MASQSVSIEQCFFWATEITRCQDYQTLTPVFIDLLNGFSWVNSACAYEIYGDIKKRSTDTTDNDRMLTKLPLDLGAEDIENTCPLLSNRELPKDVEVFTDQGKSQAILPISTDTGPDRAIIVEGHFDDEAILLLRNLLKLFHNQIIIHDHKDRDVLTRLPNRQSLDARLMEVCEYYQKAKLAVNAEGKMSWIGILDIDHFKAVNDNFGHLYGDEVLLHFSQLMKKKFRYIDFLFRYGGEEFVVILNKANKTEAEKCFDRFRQAVADYKFPLVGTVTVSIGFTCVQEQHVLPVTLLDRADKALYYAKENGRNQVILFEDMMALQDEGEDNLGDIELF